MNIDCMWIPYEGVTILGQTVCNYYRAGVYIGQAKKED